MRVRYVIKGQPEQDHELHQAPGTGDRVELSWPDGTPACFVVARRSWIHHAVIPADVVIELVTE